MYNIADTIANIDAHHSPLYFYGTLANLLAYLQIVYGVFIGFRHKSHAIPLIATMIFFAHDSFFVLNYDYWINTVHHKFFTGNLAAMSIFVCFEIVLAWQIITYSREEVGLGKSSGVALFNYLLIQAGVYVMVLWFKSMMRDPLYLEFFAISVVVSNLFNIPMLLRRGSRKGQSLVIAWALAIQTGPLYFFFVNPPLGDYFRQPIWYAAGAANTVLAFVYLWMLYRTPPYRP